MIRRTHPSPCLALLVAAAVAGVCTGLASARADTAAVDAQLFKPALDPGGFLSLESARGLGEYNFGFQFGVNFAQAPLKLDTIDEPGRDDVLSSTIMFDLGFSFGVSSRLTIAADIPFLMQSLGPGYGTDGRYVPFTDPNDEQPGTGIYSVRPDSNLMPSERPMGDVRVGAKYQILDGGLKLAAQAVAYVPFGDEDVFAGSPTFTYEPKLIAELGLGKNIDLAVNAGARLRKGSLVRTRDVNAQGFVRNDAFGNPVYFDQLYVGSEILVGAGVRVEVTPAVNVLAEAYTLIPLTTAGAPVCQADCRNGDFTGDVVGGVSFAITDDTTFKVAGGAGVISSAARNDTFRVLGTLVWAPTGGEGRRRGGKDSDNDGIPDSIDVCVNEPEDIDQFQDEDGCPELDNDLDGILDAQDMCKSEPEDRDGFEDDDGCPEGDNDNDGVADMVDRCASDPEDVDGFQDDDGCPDEDNDGDGILDKDDQCPNEAETVNGYQDMDGCPDQQAKGGPRMAATQIDLQGETIDFVGNTDRLTPAARKVLDEVAGVLTEADNAGIQVRIEVGVARSRGRRAVPKDQNLSERRAATVQSYLLGKGIPRRRLDAVGLGSTRPIVTNPADKKNDRVVFVRITQ